MVVLGDREIEARTASPRTRAGEQQEPEAWEAFADRLAAESAARGPRGADRRPSLSRSRTACAILPLRPGTGA